MIISIIFVLAGIVFLIGTLIYTKRKNSFKVGDSSDRKLTKKVKKTLTNLWDIDECENQMITINKNQHSIIVEIESIEYSLLHDEEKASVNRELVNISKMLKFPIQFLEIKKQIELDDMIEEIRLNTMNSSKREKEYSEHLISHLERLQENHNLFERKNYMIISSFNNKKVAELELKEFYKLLRYHLLNIKVRTRILNDNEIMELIYEQLHKENKNKISEIEKKGGLSLYVTDKNRKKAQKEDS